jgi:hypothetical protein
MTRKEKDAYIAVRKLKIVIAYGCAVCGKGRALEGGFARFWEDDSYNPRCFVFKYVGEPRDSDVPISQLSRSSTVKNCDQINEILARCVILCRACSDPRQARKEVTKCQKERTTTS